LRRIQVRILHRQVITPLDIERITGLSEGNIFAGAAGAASACSFCVRARLGESCHAVAASISAAPDASGGGIMGASTARRHAHPEGRRVNYDAIVIGAGPTAS